MRFRRMLTLETARESCNRAAATENAGHEDAAQSKMQDWKTRDMKMWDQKYRGRKADEDESSDDGACTCTLYHLRERVLILSMLMERVF